LKRRKFSREFKVSLLGELEAGRSLVEVCREREVDFTTVCRWKREYQENPLHAFSGKGNPSTEETKTAQLERKIGQQAMEIDFLKKVNSSFQARLAELKKKK
jgi:transposase